MTDISDASRRVQDYIHQRKLSRSDHSEYVHGYHLGTAREVSLNVSDLEMLIAATSRINEAVALLDAWELEVPYRDIAKAIKTLKGEL